jgi:predicted dehydrogenase
MDRLRVGVVGVGHLGKEHARILSGLPGVELVGVADHNAAQAEAVARRCRTRAFTDHHTLMPLVQAAVIVVPTTQHHAVAIDFLNHRVPLLVEKPLAGTPRESEQLVDLAERQGVLLQVGHIERFNPAFEALQDLPLRPKYVQSERCGGFTGRSTDIGVVLDLMVHDLDLVMALVRSPVRSVQALGVSVLGGHEDVAQARVTFADGCVADLSASRVHPSPVRRMQLWGPEGFAGIDFASRRLTLMQPAARLREGHLDARRLDTAMPATLKTELFGSYLEVHERDCNTGDQLTRELEEFVRCVRSGHKPRVDGAAGREAVALAWQVLVSLRAHPWEGDATGPCGPWQLPAPQGPLFIPPGQEAAA